MRTFVPALAVLSLVLVASSAACTGERADEAPPQVAADSPAGEPAADAGPAAAPPVDGAVAYESATHGAIEVHSASADPVDYFDVLADGERAFEGNPLLLDNAVELPPGTYEVDVNRTRRTVTVDPGAKTVLWTGDLMVRGQPETAYWYPLQDGEQMLSANPALLNRRRALFPGAYQVFVHTSVGVPDHDLGPAEVVAGRTTVLEH